MQNLYKIGSPWKVLFPIFAKLLANFFFRLSWKCLWKYYCYFHESFCKNIPQIKIFTLNFFSLQETTFLKNQNFHKSIPWSFSISQKRFSWKYPVLRTNLENIFNLKKISVFAKILTIQKLLWKLNFETCAIFDNIRFSRKREIFFHGNPIYRHIMYILL